MGHISLMFIESYWAFVSRISLTLIEARTGLSARLHKLGIYMGCISLSKLIEV